jgi:hypothetical protein
MVYDGENLDCTVVVDSLAASVESLAAALSSLVVESPSLLF